MRETGQLFPGPDQAVCGDIRLKRLFSSIGMNTLPPARKPLPEHPSALRNLVFRASGERLRRSGVQTALPQNTGERLGISVDNVNLPGAGSLHHLQQFFEVTVV